MQKVISKDGTPIAFEKVGDGPALIIMLGALADHSAELPFAEQLKSHLTVFAYDRRGRGDSGDTQPYAVEREIEDIDALIQAAGGSAFVFGASSGAVLALEGAAHGLAITRLALYEPPFVVDNTRPPLPADYVAHLNELVASGRRGEAVEYFMRDAVTVPDEMVGGMRASPMWPELEKVAHTIQYDGQIMGDTMRGHPLQAKQWASVKMPTLVMDGGASPEWLHNAARSLAKALPNAQYRTLEGQTHGVEPAAIAPVLIEFFTS